MGRAVLLAQLDQLLIDEPADRWVVVAGGPGMGKSALLAQWLAQREAAGQAVPHHFIRRGEYDWDDPDKLVSSLVAQIVARFPGQPEPEADARMHPAARLQSTLQRVSRHALVPRGKRLVVLIDGLDEYDPPTDARAGAPGRDPLAEFLPHTLPSGVSVLCASRPRVPYVDMLVARGAQQLDLDGAALADDNAATVRAFWEQAAPERAWTHSSSRRPWTAQPATRSTQRCCAGAWWGFRPISVASRTSRAVLRHCSRAPGSGSRPTRWWWTGWASLCAAREPLTLDELAMVAGWTGAASRQAFVRGARELLIESERADHAAQYRLHHDSIRTAVGRAIGEAALRARGLRVVGPNAQGLGAGERTRRGHAPGPHRHGAGVRGDAGRPARGLRVEGPYAQDLGAGERASDGHAPSHTSDVTACAVTPDGGHVVSASYDTTLKVWELASGRQVATLQGHTDGVTGCAVMPDSRYVVSASYDETLKIWELTSARPVVALQAHTDDLILGSR